MLHPAPATAAVIATLAGGLMSCAPKPASVEAKTGATVTGGPSGHLALSTIRINGLVRAVRVYAIQTPQIAQITQAGSQSNRLALVRLVGNGASVKQGDVLAEFDNTRQLDETLEAEAKYDDLGHQAKQKAAQNQSDAEKRLTELKEAEAELSKALIQLKKGPILSDIDRSKKKSRRKAHAYG